MKLRLISFSWMLLLAGNSMAQLILERQVISAFGVNLCESHCLYSTGGQVDYQGFGNEGNYIAAGFEQPDGELPLYVEIAVTYQECEDSYTAEITNISGCPNSTQYAYFWNGAEGGLIQSGMPSNVTLRVVSSDGCVFEASYDFLEMDIETISCDLIFFNFFTPNNDGDNDTWVIENISDARYSNNRVRLMNRWGNIVWEATGYDNSSKVFDGRASDNNVLPDGTYFFVVEVNEKEYQGYLELIR